MSNQNFISVALQIFDAYEIIISETLVALTKNKVSSWSSYTSTIRKMIFRAAITMHFSKEKIFNS